MTGDDGMPDDGRADPLADAVLAIRLCALDPSGLGGLVVRGAGAAEPVLLDTLATAMARGAPVRRVPGHIDDERLLGGIDLGATLAQGVLVARRGVLAEADGGAVILPMAERMSEALAARITAAIDAGEVVTGRDGVMLAGATRFVTLALDDGAVPEERVPAALADRLAFAVDLSGLRALPMAMDAVAPTALSVASVTAAGDDVLEALASVAAMLGVESARPLMFALRAARASAALSGRRLIVEDDVALAARLVLAPRATRLPAGPDAADSSPPPPPPPENDPDAPSDSAPAPDAPLADVVLEAVLASLPRDVLARLAAGDGRRSAVVRARGGGERRRSTARGRPVGARAGMPRGGLRLSLIDTLKAAAPWQRLRGGGNGRVAIRRDDLRIRRFETRAEALTIFAVDASGSAAFSRMAEAKGAVELLLAEAYVKRAHVALVAFRGTGAEILLPPTRSLARAKRSLADLPGGGGTPLGAGLNAARALAEAARARGRTPFLVVLTDGRANIAADGTSVRSLAEQEATDAAKAIGAAGIAAAFVDISPRPRPEGAALSAVMGARYLPLPRADARAMHAAVTGAR